LNTKISYIILIREQNISKNYSHTQMANLAVSSIEFCQCKLDKSDIWMTLSCGGGHKRDDTITNSKIVLIAVS